MTSVASAFRKLLPSPDCRLTERYPDSTVRISPDKFSSGNQTLTRCAFLRTNPTGELIHSGLPVTRAAIHHGDRAALAHAFVKFALKGSGFASDRFQFRLDPPFTPVSKKSHQSCTTRVTTAGSSMS
jgi:hypothetical protein